MERRKFVKLGMGVAAAGIFAPALQGLAAELLPSNKLPKWRGFNLLEKFNSDVNQPFKEWDFKKMAEWGFDFARLPMSYHCWSKPDDWMKMDEAVLKEIDQAVAYGAKYKIHVNLNLHRIPGYCVNAPAEPLNLWKDEKALEAAVYHWQQFAKRYKGISSSKLSFDLINEPSQVEEPDYVRVVTRIIQAIRKEDPSRLIVIDGLQYGTKPVFGAAGLNVGQSTRGYGPMQVSHYKASWVKTDWAVPTWPLFPDTNDRWDKARLKKDIFDAWKKLADQGVGVHVGEWGAYQHTPHDVSLAWMKDNLEIFKENGWGWSLWNFRGSFGILDSERKDVDYEEYEGHKLDRKMLNLLQQY
ncbi:glycoside hydrolase family 5 protein [Pedobacter psychroterrae]|uniref:Glycoside hydrolase n=1 Tax=Pedobacter psychroterrae TaxID=2530453 RepID=A0A4R0NKS2_9SPHI|nr:cellulase family glycosylhydrolase [Pedobacter psychroterrae]TCD01186.1 glycoside hydrolase [Pedobacter psychroterrae]